MGKIIKDGVEYDFGSDIIYHLIGSGDSGGSSEGDSESNSGIKVVELGALGETFDLTQYEGYENFTLDNFYVQVDSASSKAGTAGINKWTDSHGRTAYFAKSEITGGSASLSELLSYDASTGQLTTKKTGSGSVTMQAVNYNDSYDKKSASASLSLTVEGTVYLIQASESGGDSNNSTSELVDGNISLVYSKTSQSDISYTIPETGTYTIIATGSQTWLSEDHVTITGFEADTTTTFTNDGSGPHCSKIAHNVQLNEGDVIGVSGCTNNSLLVYKAEVPVESGGSDGGIGGNANTVLLWSQPANGDGTRFNAQTLSLPEIANYEGVAIKCCLCNNSSNGYVNEVMTYYFEKGTSMRVGMRASYDNPSMATVYRVIEVTEDSVIFNDAYNTSTADGRYIYPMEIYGYTTAEIGGSGKLDGDVVLGGITEILASGVSNTYTILEDGLYHITSFQGGTYFPIYINDVNQGETVGVNGVVSKTIADGANPVITSLSYLLNLNEGDVVTTTNVNATLAISKIESNVADGENTGNTVEEEKVLLWENASPTSNFAAQTITLSESIENFDWLEIHVYQSTTLQTKPAVYRYQVEQLMDETFHMNYPNKDSFGFVNRGESNGTPYSRQFGFISSTEMYISESLQRNPIKVSATTAEMIPYQIYGVKNGITTTVDYADYYQQITMTAKTYSTFDLPVPLSKIGSVYIVNESYSTKTAVSYVKAYDEAKWHSGYNGIPYDLDTLDAGSVYKFNITENQFQFYTANAGTYGVYITGVSENSGGAPVTAYLSDVPLFESWGVDSGASAIYFDISSFSTLTYNCTKATSIRPVVLSKDLTWANLLQIGAETGEHEIDITEYPYLTIDYAIGASEVPQFSKFVFDEDNVNVDTNNSINYGDFESFAKFVNNCNTTFSTFANIYIDDFSKVKSFTYEVTATNYSSYIRYKNDSGTITNIFGDNYTEHGISAGKSATITKTVNCEELNFDVGYPVFWALGSSTNITNLKITSYEMVDGYTYPEADGSGSTTHDVKLEIQGGGAINAYVDIDGERVISYTQPSGTAWGGRVETAEFTCYSDSNSGDAKANIPTKLLKTITSPATNGTHSYTITKDEIGDNDSILMVSSISTGNGGSTSAAANNFIGATNASYTIICDTRCVVVAKLYDIKGDITVTILHNMANIHEQNSVMFYGYDVGETEGSGGSAGGNTTPTVQLPSGVTLTSNAAYRGNTSCSTYFIKGTEQAIFSTSCVNEEEKYKGQLASATSTITIKSASGTTIHTQNITTNTNTTFTFDWDAYGCDIIFVTLSIADAQVTYYTNSVSIATV